jgi:hypothetical protein
MKPKNEDCVIFPGRLPKKDIGFVNALLDDHEGMVVVRTVEAEEGRMEYWVSPDMVEEFKIFAAYIRDEIHINMTLDDPIPITDEMIDFLEKTGGIIADA